MKFCKKYEEYMQSQQNETKYKLPGVGFKNLKKILKRCRFNEASSSSSSSMLLLDHHPSDNGNNNNTCIHSCPVCDGSFFPSLMKEMSMVVGCFNERAQKVLDVHLATGFRKYLVWCKDKFQGNHDAFIQEGKDLVGYAVINAIAMRKILKKYDKIHDSKQGQAFRSQVQSMHLEILQSPWLCELIAFHINIRETKTDIGKGSELFEGCSLVFSDGKPSLSCELSDAVKLEIDLTCSICLDTVFDPVYLTCGHIFCFMCACKSGSVTIVDGLKATDPTAKCPLCREAGVYQGSLHLDELNILLSRRYIFLCHKCFHLSRDLSIVLNWSIWLSRILGGKASNRESRKDSPDKGALGITIACIFGDLNGLFSFPPSCWWESCIHRDLTIK